MGTLNIVECDDYRSAMMSAMEEAVNTSGKHLAMIQFRQGNRNMLSGSIPFVYIKELLITNAAKKNSSIKELQDATNRPVILDHAKEIARYVNDNLSSEYILGALTLNINQTANFYTLKTSSDTRIGYLVIPQSSKIDITDGQHRTDAVKLLFPQLSDEAIQDFNRQSIAVVITAESNIKQIHQDFADASKTKQLPAAMLTAFDMRNPANRIVLMLEEKCQLFRGLVDATSKSLSKKSNMVFTANHLRQFVKVAFTGSWQLGSASFDEKASEIFKTVEDFEGKLAQIAEFVNYLVPMIPAWREISELDKATAPARILALRTANPVCLTPTGLVIIARIAYEIFYKYAAEIKERGEVWQFYADRLGSLNWRKDDEMWAGNICQPDAKGMLRILQQQNLIRQALLKVRDCLGLLPFVKE